MDTHTLPIDRFITALAARCNLALARFMKDQDEAEHLAALAQEQAFKLGSDDYRASAPISPLLADEEALRIEWEDGRTEAQIVESIFDEEYVWFNDD